MTQILLILAGACFLLAAIGVLSGRETLGRLALAAPIIAAALVFVAFTEAPREPAGPYGRAWISLEKISLAAPAGSHFTLGGDPDTDDLVISAGAAGRTSLGRGRLPADVLTFAPVDGRSLALTPTTRPLRGNAAVIRVEDTEGVHYLGATPVAATARACLSVCDSAKPKLDRLRRGAVYTARAAPLYAEGRPLAAPGDFYFTTPDRGKLYAMGAPTPYRLKPDETVTLSVFEAAEGLEARGPVAASPGRFILRRSFDLTYAGGRIVLRPHTPETEVLTLDQGPQGRPAVGLSSGAGGADAQVEGEVLASFGLLGRAFDPELADLSFDVARTSDDVTILHRKDGGQSPFQHRVTVGEDHSLTLAMRTLDFASGVYRWAPLFVAVSLLVGMATTVKLRLADPLFALIFGAVEVSMVLRVLVAVEGAFVDAAAKTQQAAPAALIALPLALFVCLAAHPEARRQRFELGCLALLVLAAVGLVRGSTGETPPTAWLALAVTAAAGAASLAGWPGALRGVYERSVAFVETLAMPPPDTAPPAWRRAGGAIAQACGPAAAIAGIGALGILAARSGFAGIGLREGINIGDLRIALSLLFVPLTLAVAAPLLAAASRPQDGATQTRQALALLVLLAVGVLIPSRVVRDAGFAIFALPLIVAAVAAYAAARPSRTALTDGGLALLAVAPVLLGLVLWVLGAPYAHVAGLGFSAVAIFALILWRAGAAWLTPAVGFLALLAAVNLIGVAGALPQRQMSIDQAVETQTNELRMFAVLAPERLSLVGTRGAEALEDTNDHMRAYADTWFGRGYFHLPEPSVLKPYHLTDNVSAVHLLSPFGRLGALAFLALFGAAGAAACARALERGDATSWLGAGAVLTLSFVSIYMVLANVLAAPFTGRNVYLLAATSTADLLEGLLLAAIAIATLVSAREDAA